MFGIGIVELIIVGVLVGVVCVALIAATGGKKKP
jgi:hypothetical protein